ncbi:hypothetical protein PMAYCL1PPCAC_33039 [Pristionchus mayeri]|uniref:F-box domain-containing protein n=1 Tax=Pristionchus mayeri TaxID=1317129 RepID=A0AAN5DIM1_9BILA|nr:hypothetical protein PMAYCL1PPCAC_33039 [Pristionchus mayeri]
METESLSLFELLPSELAWKIIDFVPEAVFNLRLTSRMLHARVNEYAHLRVSTHILEELSIYKTRDAYKREDLVAISMFTPVALSNIFEIHLKLRLLTCGRNKIERRCVKMDNKHMNVYLLKLTEPIAAETIVHLRGCFGETIGKTTLLNCNDRTILSTVPKLIKGKTFSKLDFAAVDLHSDAVDFIKRAITEHQVDHFSLGVSTAPNPVRLLLDLSTLVRSLFIHQCQIVNKPRSFATECLLGLECVDWAPTILEMFQNGKMDKLLIDNLHYHGYLQRASLDILAERLPKLTKNIWFTSTSHYYGSGQSYYQNGYYIQADSATANGRFLRVRHTTRMHESSEL